MGNDDIAGPPVLPPVVGFTPMLGARPRGASPPVLSREIGLPRGYATMAGGHTVLTPAIVYRIVPTRIGSVSRSILEASRDHGAMCWQNVRTAMAPQLGRAVAAAAMWLWRCPSTRR